MISVKFIATNGDTFDSHARDGDVAVVSFSRREVDGYHLADALDRLLNLSDNPDHVVRFRDQLTFMFEGREADPREIHQIPEAVKFFRALTRAWPYWTHFVEKHGDTAGMVMSMLCDVDVVAVDGAGRVSCSFRDQKQFADTLEGLFAGQNALYEAYGLSATENMATTDAFLAALGVD